MSWSADSGLTWSKGPVPEDAAVLFRATIKNRGDASSPPQKIIRLELQVDGQAVAWRDISGGLAAGQSITRRADAGPDDGFWLPSTPGQYAVKAVVDSTGQVAESNETNNSLTKTIEIEATITQAEFADVPTLPAPLLSERFADGGYRTRGWSHGYHPQIHDTQLNRSVYRMRWDGTGRVPVIVAGTTTFPLYKRLPTKVKEMTVAFKVIEVTWDSTDGAHFIGTVPAQDLNDNLQPLHGNNYLSQSAGRFYFEPTQSNFRWGGIMQANWSNATGWDYFNSANNVMVLGQWHEVVTHAKQNDVGQANGVFRVSIRRRGLGANGTWRAWSQIVNATFGGMVTSNNPNLIQSWITIEQWRSALEVKEMRLCDLRVYARNQYDAYKAVNS
jgi:hypothetical protein